MQLEEIKGTMNWQKPETMSIVPYFREFLYLNIGIT
jgi:hypothetical protein